MIAMQYSISLSNDFGNQKIRARVQARYSLFDKMPGLIHKSYLFNTKDRLYAPFYIWRSHEAARDFLLSKIFQDVSDTFRRPRVRMWNIFSYDVFDAAMTPTVAVREVDPIPAEQNLATLAAEERRAHDALRGKAGLHSHAVALDADRWELVRFSLWRDDASANGRFTADTVQTYDVLHLSMPPDGD
jgi:heme-degrading monooxygenase HmoA